MRMIMENVYILKMRNHIYKSIILGFSVVLLSCSAASRLTKPDKICTTEFRMISVQFKDANGSSIAVTDFRSINLRTNLGLTQNNEGLPGYYTVASDADLHMLSPKGDTIRVTASHPETKKTVSGLFVVSGGKDACHVEKLSGPETITIN